MRNVVIASFLLSALSVSGCANSALKAPGISSSPLSHGSLTDGEYNLAVAAARAEVDKETAAITSATATIGAGTVTDTNAGPPCTSGRLLHITLIGTFPHTVIGLQPTDGSQLSVTAVLVTADAVSGKPCLIGVRADPMTPDPAAALLFTK